MKNRLQKLTGTMFRLFSSYFLIIIICTMSMGFISYSFLSRALQEQSIRSNTQLLNQFKSSVDSYILQNIDRLSCNTLQNVDINKDIVYFFSNPPLTNAAAIQNVYRYLQYLKTTNSIIDSISVYYKNYNMLISSEGMKYLSPMAREDWIDAGWVENLSLTRNNAWTENRSIPDPRNSGRSYKNVITYIRQYPFSASPDNCQGGIAISVPEDVLYNNIMSMATADLGQIFIINASGTVISHSQKQHLSTNIKEKEYGRTICNSDTADGYFITDVNGIHSVVSYTSSGYNDWRYVAVKPIASFREKAAYFQRVILLVAVITFAIAFLLSLKSARKFYSPLKRLASISAQIANPAHSSPGSNEFDIINSTLDILSSKVSEQQHKLEINLPAIKHNFILNIVNNRYYNSSDIYDKLQLLGCTLPYKLFAAVVVLCGHDSSGADGSGNSNMPAADMVQSAEQALSRDDICCIFTESDEHLVGIINFNAGETDAASALGSLQQSLKNKTGAGIHIGFGDVYENISDVHISYRQAVNYINYSFIYPETPVFTTASTCRLENGSSDAGKQHLERFCTALKAFDRQESSASLHALIAAIRREHYSYAHACRLLDYAVVTLDDFVNRLSITEAGISTGDMYSQYKKIESILELEEWLQSVIGKIFAWVQYRHCSRNKELVAKIQDYVKRNILKPDLNLNTLSQAFSINPSYLSRVYKEETGSNFIDDLMDARLEYAKELLLCSNKKIDEIAGMVGYGSPQYLIKRFKCRYGITPKQFQIEKKREQAYSNLTQ